MEKDRKGASNETAPKVGVYVCHCGGNISDHVDVERVCEAVEKVPGVASVKHNMFMCSDPGQELIMEDMKEGTIDRVVVASCAPALHETTFRSAITRAGGNPFLYDHANIREQVSWVHHGEGATQKAIRLVAAAAAKARGLKPLEPFRMEARKHATVVGGGIAGLRASLDLAQRGIKVTLLEKSPFLGGWTARWNRVSPTGESGSDLVWELAKGVMEHRDIEVFNCAQITDFDGFVGNFKLAFTRRPIKKGDYPEQFARMEESGAGPGDLIPLVGLCPSALPEKEETHRLETGVVILATGFTPYRPREGEYGYGRFEQVITLPELMRALAAAPGDNRKGILQVHGRPVRNVAMIHCVGSRQIPGIHEELPDKPLNQYCSRTCCSATVYTANVIRERFPETHVFEFYRDIRTYGRGHEEVYDEASQNGVLFFRFEPESPPEVEANPWTNDGSSLVVRVKDTLTFGEEIEVGVDLVVLSVGMEPNNVSDLVEMMKLPVGTDQFLLEVHPKLRPVEVSIAGVLLAGTSQAPFDIGETCAAAAGAAAKASAILASGYVELDPYVAEVDLGRCKGTGACVEACVSEGALRMVKMEVDGQKVMRPEVSPALCLGCGACTAVCPEGAINVLGWTLGQYEDMVDAIVSDELAA